MKKGNLKTIKEIYKNGRNIIEYFKKNEKTKKNTLEMIMISYDFQSGNYIKNTKENSEFNEKYTMAISKVIDSIDVEYNSILEAGVGEATTLVNLIPKLKINPQNIYGFDLSWSRVKYAIEYGKEQKIENLFLFMGNLFNIPLADNSIDVVYTSHSIEPNSGREKEALQELIRITKKYLILLEPAYEFADTESRRRMRKHGYIKSLHSVALSLELDVVEHRLFDIFQNPLNPTGLIIIKKDEKNNQTTQSRLICPITKTPLELIKNSYFTKKGLLVYPIIGEVPCLIEDSAIIATHYNGFR